MPFLGSRQGQGRRPLSLPTTQPPPQLSSAHLPGTAPTLVLVLLVMSTAPTLAMDQPRDAAGAAAEPHHDGSGGTTATMAAAQDDVPWHHHHHYQHDGVAPPNATILYGATAPLGGDGAPGLHRALPPTLVELTLVGTVTMAAVTHLTRLTRLEAVDDGEFDFSDPPSLAPLAGLRALDLGITMVPDGPAPLACLSDLTTLTYLGASFVPAESMPLNRLRDLESVRFKSASLPTWRCGLAGLPRLKRLNLGSGIVGLTPGDASQPLLSAEAFPPASNGGTPAAAGAAATAETAPAGQVWDCPAPAPQPFPSLESLDLWMRSVRQLLATLPLLRGLPALRQLKLVVMERRGMAEMEEMLAQAEAQQELLGAVAAAAAAADAPGGGQGGGQGQGGVGGGAGENGAALGGAAATYGPPPGPTLRARPRHAAGAAGGADEMGGSGAATRLFDVVAHHLISHMPFLTSISLDFSAVSQASAREALAAVEVMEAPTLGGSAPSAAERLGAAPFVSLVRALPGLEEVVVAAPHMSGSGWVSDEGLAALAAGGRLRKLGLHSFGPGVTAGGLERLLRLPTLESLTVWGCEGVGKEWAARVKEDSTAGRVELMVM